MPVKPFNLCMMYHFGMSIRESRFTLRNHAPPACLAPELQETNNCYLPHRGEALQRSATISKFYLSNTRTCKSRWKKTIVYVVPLSTGICRELSLGSNCLLYVCLAVYVGVQHESSPRITSARIGQPHIQETWIPRRKMKSISIMYSFRTTICTYSKTISSNPQISP